MVEANTSQNLFRADKTILLIVSNGDYKGTRDNPALTSYEDIESAMLDSNTAQKFLSHHKDQYISVVRNAS